MGVTKLGILSAPITNAPRVIGLNLSFKFSTMRKKGDQASAVSLTIWSSRHPQASLAGALRASHSGAAYRER